MQRPKSQGGAPQNDRTRRNTARRPKMTGRGGTDGGASKQQDAGGSTARECPSEPKSTGLSMSELYANLFRVPEQIVDVDRWRRKNNALHNALHEKLIDCSSCTVCAASRLWQDSRVKHADWSFKALAALWDLTVSTILEHGTAWQAWRPTRAVRAPQSIPPKLPMEDIPRDQVQQLPG